MKNEIARGIHYAIKLVAERCHDQKWQERKRQGYHGERARRGQSGFYRHYDTFRRVLLCLIDCLFHGQDKRKFTSMAPCALGPYPASMKLDELFRQRQPEARAVKVPGIGRLDLREFGEKQWNVFM